MVRGEGQMSCSYGDVLRTLARARDMLRHLRDEQTMGNWRHVPPFKLYRVRKHNKELNNKDVE